jgi:D-aspartate ligase
LAAICNGLGAIRSLGRKHIPVIAFDHHPETYPTRHSKYTQNMYSPKLEINPEQLLEMLINLGKRMQKPGILFPTSDAFVEFVNENREELGKYFKYSLPEKNILRQLLNKKTQYILAEEVNTPVPKTFYPKTIQEAEQIARQLNYPAIIKGLVSTEWRTKFPVQKVVLAKNAETLIRAFSEINDFAISMLVQEVVVGPDSNSIILNTYMNKNSEELLVLTYKKIRCYPCYFGVASVAESTYVPEVADLGLSFLKKIGFVGMAQIEFKRDIRDNAWRLIEINPCRTWMQNILAERCGMNFPYTM